MITFKKWSGTAWVEESPKVGTDTIVASGTPSASTFLRGDGAWATPPNTNNYPTSLSFNTTNGILTMGRNGLTDLTVDLDGKYAEKANSNYYVEGNSGGTAGTWTGTISDITALYTGLSIDYKINTAGASTTTLNINSYGAKTVRRNTGNLTTHLPVGTVVHLVYDGTYWVWADYDQGADHNVMFINNVIFGEATQGYHLLMEGTNGKMYPVTSGGNAGSTTNTITSAELKVGGSMVYYGSSTDYAANAAGGAYSLFTATYSSELEYWSNKSTGWATAGLPFYIVGSINANGNLVLDGAGTTGNAFITQTLPTTDDGKVYIQVGFMRNTYDEWTLVSEHPMYVYKNGQLRLYGGEYVDYAADANKLDGNHASELSEYGSSSDFADGTLVTTSLDASAASGASWTIEVKGKGYGLTPFHFIAEGYNYNSTFINTHGYNYGASDISTIKVLKFTDGKLAFWWPRVGYWNSFSVKVADTTTSGVRKNTVTSVGNSTEPTSDKKVTINLVRAIFEGDSRLTNARTPTAHTHSATDINVGGISVIGKSTTGGGATAELGMSTLQTMLGLGSAAYTTSSAYATASHTHTFASLTSKPTTLSGYGITDALASSLKGAVNGVAELDATGKVPSTQLPSYVDDVLEYANLAGFPTTGDTGKIYIALDTNITYRWSGTAYVEISASLALGETSATAYRGDRGKTAYDHSQVTTGAVHGATTVGNSFFRLTNPSAITFPRINADNSVSALDAASFRTAIGAGTSSTTGTVTSVGLSMPTGFTVTNSPVTTSGTLTVALTSGYELLTTGTQTISGDKTFSSTITGSVSGNAGTATKLATARTINGVSFDGSANITVADSTKMPTAGGTFTGDVTMDKISSDTTSNSDSIIFRARTAGVDFTRALLLTSAGALTFNGTALSLSGHTHTYSDLTGTVPTWNQDTTGNAATADNATYADQFTNAITLTIGSSAQSLNGSANLTYSLAAIGAASTSHTHGDISSDGLISTQTTMGTGDALLLADSSASGKVIKSDITLDTTNTTQYLRRDGAWVTPPTASHTHGDISNTGTITSTAVTPVSGDYILISDTSASGAIKRAIALGSSTTTFLRNDGTWQTGTGAVQSVNGLTGALNTEVLATGTSTVNSVTYGYTYGQAIINSSATRMRIATGFYAPSGSSSGNAITFGTTFAAVPLVIAFCLKAGSTTATVLGAKVTTASKTGATIISSYVTGSSSGYTPAAETYGWIAIGY